MGGGVSTIAVFSSGTSVASATITAYATPDATTTIACTNAVQSTSGASSVCTIIPRRLNRAAYTSSSPSVAWSYSPYEAAPTLGAIIPSIGGASSYTVALTFSKSGAYAISPKFGSTTLAATAIVRVYAAVISTSNNNAPFSCYPMAVPTGELLG